MDRRGDVGQLAARTADTRGGVGPVTDAPSLTDLIAGAIHARWVLVDGAHESAFRLFNGHLEGDPRYVVDVYGRTAVVFRHAPPLEDDDELTAILSVVRGRLPWVRAAIVKEREGATDEARRGRVFWEEKGEGGGVDRGVDPGVDPGAGGSTGGGVGGGVGAGVGERTGRDPGGGPGGGTRVDTAIREHGVRYAIDLLMNQDASFYLDTRLLRRWLIDHSEGKRVLNTFAYTGSLGVAARAGGAARVLHTDLNRRFLNVAKASYALNGFLVEKRDFQAQDFFSIVRGLKLRGERFDTVILDPPFFSSTRGGTVDLNQNAARLVNKVRPLVTSGGTLAVVNNALFVSGAEFLGQLEALCAGGWMEIAQLVEVPEDVTGYAATRRGEPAADPAPFAHSTKIALLTVRHR
jgi:23S rRNA (cytosine1962-C5)-methyltransferase